MSSGEMPPERIDLAEGLFEAGIPLEAVGEILAAVEEGEPCRIDLEGTKWEIAAISRPGWVSAESALLCLAGRKEADVLEAEFRNERQPIEDELFATLFPLGIMVVDDNPVSLEFADKLLRRLGYRALLAASAETALERIENSDTELVIADLRLPGIDGYELRDRLKALEPGRSIQVFASSADGMDDPAEAEKFDGELAKPLTLEKLRRIIMDTFGYASRGSLPASASDEGIGSAATLSVEEWAFDPTLHRELIGMMLKTLDNVVPEIEAAIRDGDWKRFEERVHFLKGGADVVRADRLTGICQAALSEVRSGNSSSFEAFLPRLRDAWRELVKWLDESGYMA